MDELENHPLSLLLLHHPEYFSQFIEWTKTVHLHHFILFLLEIDYVHFRSDERFRSYNEKVNLQQGYYFLSNAIQASTSSTNERHRDFVSHYPQLVYQSKAIQRLVESRVPCVDGFSEIAQSVWQGMLRQGQMLTQQPNTIWPSLRRFLVENANIPLDHVLNDSSRRRYLEKFLQADPSDLICLQCYISIQRIFADLAPYSVPSANAGSTYGTNIAGIASASKGEEKEKKVFNIRKWKASGKATLTTQHSLSSHSKAISEANDPYGLQNYKIYHQFVDPYESFRTLLGGSRALQRQYFPVTAQAASTQASTANSILGMSNVSRNRRSSSAASMLSSSSGGTGQGGAGSAPPASGVTCAGLSDSLRLEITACLTSNKAVRLEDIEIIEVSYAIANAHILDHHLHAISRDLYRHLQNKYKTFVETSNEYVTMLAYIHAVDIEAIQKYMQKMAVLSEFVSEKGEVMHWAEPRARGVLFLKYNTDIKEEEEELKDKLPGRLFQSPQHMNSNVSLVLEREPGERLDFSKVPTILAAKLDICVPEDLVLNKENALYLPHTLHIYSNKQEDDDEVDLDQLSSSSSDLDYNSDNSSVYSEIEVQTVVKNKAEGSGEVDKAGENTAGSVDYDALFDLPAAHEMKEEHKHHIEPEDAQKGVITLQEVTIDTEHVEDSIVNQYGNIGIASRHNLLAYNPLTNTTDLIFSLLQALGLDNLDYMVPTDQTHMTSVENNPLYADLHNSLQALYGYLFTERKDSKQCFKVVVSIKVHPYPVPLAGAEALRKVEQSNHMLHVVEERAANAQTRSKLGKQQTKYVAGVQIVFSFIPYLVEGEEGMEFDNRRRYSNNIQLLREVNYQLKHCAGHKHVHVKDYHRVAYQELLEKVYRVSKESLHPMFTTEETLYDFYLGSHMPAVGKTGGEYTEEELSLLRTLSYTKLYGVFDTSLCTMFSSVNLRIFLQISFLLLTASHQHIVLISSSSALLMKMQSALPRLLHPFPLLYSLLPVQNTSLAYEVFRLKKRSALHTMTNSISNSALNSPKTLRNTISDPSMSTSSFHLPALPSPPEPPILALSSNQPVSPNRTGNVLSPSSPTSPTGRSIPRPACLLIPDSHLNLSLSRSYSEGDMEPPLSPAQRINSITSIHSLYSAQSSHSHASGAKALHLAVPSNPSLDSHGSHPRSDNNQNSNAVYLLDARVYFLVRADLTNQLAEATNPSLLQSVVAFDLDTNTVIDSFLSSSTTNTNSNNAANQPNNLQAETDSPTNNHIALDLTDPKLFQCANFEALRQLLHSISSISSCYAKDTAALHAISCITSKEDEVKYYSRLASITLRTNSAVEQGVRTFWQEIFLQALPAHVFSLSEYGVILCDMQSILGKLLSCYMTSPYQQGGSGGQSQVSSPYGALLTPPPPLTNHAVYSPILNMEFDEFLSFFNEHTASAGRSLIHAFYADFLAGLSPVFLSLLRKHTALVRQGKY